MFLPVSIPVLLLSVVAFLVLAYGSFMCGKRSAAGSRWLRKSLAWIGLFGAVVFCFSLLLAMSGVYDWLVFGSVCLVASVFLMKGLRSSGREKK